MGAAVHAAARPARRAQLGAEHAAGAPLALHARAAQPGDDAGSRRGRLHGRQGRGRAAAVAARRLRLTRTLTVTVTLTPNPNPESNPDPNPNPDSCRRDVFVFIADIADNAGLVISPEQINQVRAS